METFDADWLALREPVDHRSRAEPLLTLLGDAWRARGWSRVLDLGSGAGSNLRFLTPHLHAGQQWLLVDHDLDHVRALRSATVPASAQSVTVMRGDLAHEGLAAVARVDLVTASALLDLVSEGWLNRLVDACADARCGAYFALSYDGEIRWSGGESGDREQPDLDDAMVREAVNGHQKGDKDLGAALGPGAGTVAERLFRTAGYQTWQGPSPWQLSGADALLVGRLIDGWEAAAVEVAPSEVPRIRAWAARRRETVARGRFTLKVGHGDLLALPPERQ
ncbi:MAG: class I SAM-dependent methyltransferase [Vicinamibacterales bacterium]|jgi:SAM-dependent methyltransferase|nr:class I SAM-dependent methyltransferase [Vicinamibacterales bacterium]